MARRGKRDKDGGSLSKDKSAEVGPPRSSSKYKGVGDGPGGSVEASLRHLEEEDNFAWDPISNQIAVKIRSDAADCFYPRASTRDIRNALAHDDFEDGYWLAQAIHYGLPLTVNRKGTKKRFQQQLRDNERLTPPVRLLQLGSLLQDRAKDEPVLKEEVEPKQEPESDDEPVQRPVRAKQDSDEDYVAGEDDSVESEDEGNNDNTEEDDHITAKEVQELEPTRSPRLPRHADRPVRSIEDSTEQTHSLRSDEDDGFDLEQDTPPASVSRSRSGTNRKSARSGNRRPSRSGDDSDLEPRPLSSPSFTRPRTSKKPQHLSIALPGHLSDASDYLTAAPSSASNPNSAAFENPAARFPALTVRSARPTPIDVIPATGGNLSTEAPTCQGPGGRARRSPALTETSGTELVGSPLVDNIPVRQRPSHEKLKPSGSSSSTYVNNEKARIAPTHWHPDLTKIEGLALIRDEIKSRLHDGQHADRDIDFCIHQAAGDPELSYQNYIQATHVRWLDPRPMSIYLRRKLNIPYRGPPCTLVDRHAAKPQSKPQSLKQNDTSRSHIRAQPQVSQPWDASQIRAWVPIDQMDMGPVYHAQKSCDGYIVRTHEGILQNYFPRNAYEEGQVRLRLQEKWQLGFHVRVPPRTGYDVRYKKVEERKVMLRRKSAKQVGLKRADGKPSVSDHPHIEGNVSYNGHCRIPRQLEAVGAAGHAGNKSSADATNASELPAMQATTKSKSSSRRVNEVAASEAVRESERMDLDELETASAARSRSVPLPVQRKDEIPSTTASKTGSEARRGQDQGKKSEEQEIHGKKKRKHPGEEGPKIDRMAHFSAKMKRRKIDKDVAANIQPQTASATGETDAPPSNSASDARNERKRASRPMELQPKRSQPRKARKEKMCGSYSVRASPACDGTASPPAPDADGAGNVSESQPSSDESDSDGGQSAWRCKWGDCDVVCDSVRKLVNHVRVRHVGYVKTGTLSLTCSWSGCSATLSNSASAVRHIKVHVPWMSHPCSLCPKGYKHHHMLLRHVADKHSGGVLKGQGFPVLKSGKPANRQRTQLIRDEESSRPCASGSAPTAARRNLDDQGVGMHELEQDSVADENSSAEDGGGNSDEDDGEASSSEDERSRAEDEESSAESEYTHSEEDSNRALHTEATVENSSGDSPGAGGQKSYEPVDIDETVQFIQTALDRELAELREQQRPKSDKSKCLYRMWDEWQAIARDVQSGAVETLAEAQLREGLQEQEAVKEQLKKPASRRQRCRRKNRLKKLKVKARYARKAVEAERQSRQQ